MDSRTVIPGISAPAVIQYAQPTTGQSVTIADTTDTLMLDPAGTLATLTVVLPTGAQGKRVTISSSQILTALTITGTIVGTLTTLALGGFAQFTYSSSASKWFRTG